MTTQHSTRAVNYQIPPKTGVSCRLTKPNMTSESRAYAIYERKAIGRGYPNLYARIAYYSGFLYCAFGRPYACVVTLATITTVSAG